MAITMALLGVLALFFGFMAFNWPGSYAGFGTFLFFEHAEVFHFTWWLGILSTVLAVAAFGYAYLAYVRRSVPLEGVRGRFAGLLKIVENKYYIDELYQWGVDRVMLSLSGFVAWTDRALVNDVGINGPANVVRRLGVALRLHVTGFVYSYALAMALGLIGLAIFWWIRST
jgi:NADH-quinone oxidoreductase subunit L